MLAAVSCILGLRKRIRHALNGGPILLIYVKVGVSGANRVGGENHSLNGQVRQVLHEQAIFFTARLIFPAVEDHVMGSLFILRCEEPFLAGRESCASPAAETCSFNFSNDLLGREIFYLRQCLIAPAAPVIVQVFSAFHHSTGKKDALHPSS